jgi:phosphatidylinositol glycan class Q protein
MMLPTVALYYFWFLLIVLFIYIVNVFLNAVLQILNHFPLFLLIQYYRNPFYFPVGVTLDVGKVSQDETVHATIRPTKMPINYIFKSFI